MDILRLYLRGGGRGKFDLLFLLLFLLLLLALHGGGSLGVPLLRVTGRVRLGLGPRRFPPLFPLPLAP